MIYDCFTFFNEFELLHERVELLSPVVDRFIIVQGTRTHQGAVKPVHDMSAIPRCISLTYNSDSCPNDCWEREYGQRNAIVMGLPATGNGVAVISDVDEIPNPEAIKGYDGRGIAALEMDLFYYNRSTRCKHKWHAARITTLETLRRLTPNQVRLMEPDYIIRNGGNHFSCFGGVEKLQEKMRCTAHAEYNTPEFTSREHLEHCISNGLDFLKRRIEFEQIT